MESKWLSWYVHFCLLWRFSRCYRESKWTSEFLCDVTFFRFSVNTVDDLFLDISSPKVILGFLPLSSYSSRTHFSVRDRCPHIVFLAFGLVEPPLLVWQIDSFTTHVILFNNSYERQTIMVIAKHVVHQWFSPSHVHLYEFWINNLYISHLPLSKFIEVTETSKYLDCLLGRIHDLRRTAKWRKLKLELPNTFDKFDFHISNENIYGNPDDRTPFRYLQQPAHQLNALFLPICCCAAAAVDCMHATMHRAFLRFKINKMLIAFCGCALRNFVSFRVSSFAYPMFFCFDCFWYLCMTRKKNGYCSRRSVFMISISGRRKITILSVSSKRWA